MAGDHGNYLTGGPCKVYMQASFRGLDLFDGGFRREVLQKQTLTIKFVVLDVSWSIWLAEDNWNGP